ncbi:MAG TPA: Ig-like domain repeat protein [Verrucomicrobiae bacterium]|nr:Ig-like domain repeat protein [Verrucomicrobiae bacterium]
MKNPFLHRNRFLTVARRMNRAAQLPRLAVFKLALVALLACAAGSAYAANASVTTLASKSISADFAGTSTYTNLTGPAITEGTSGDVGTGDIVLNAPSGFQFNTGVTVTATVTRSGATGGTLLVLASSTATVASGSITIHVNTADIGGAKSIITWSGIQAQPTSGTFPVTNPSNVTMASGGATVNGITAGTTSFGALTEVAGAANKLAFGVQPSTTTAGSAISPSVTVIVQDQFGNMVTGDSSTVTIASSTTAFTGSTLSKAASSGVATFNAIKPTTAGSANTLTASDGSLTGATSSTFTVNPAALDHFAISAISSPQTAGTAITSITLTAQDIFNNTTNYTGTVTYSGTAGITGTSAAFTAGQLSGVSVTPTVAGSSETFTVTASGNSGTATFNVNAGAATKLVFTTSPVTVTAGVASGTITVQRQDQYNNPNNSDATISVTLSSSSSGTVTFTPASPLSIANGSSNANFTYTDTKAGTPTITAASSGLTSGTQQETVNPAALDHFAISAISSPQTAGTAITGITLTAQDQFSNTVTSFGNGVTYSGTAGITGSSGNFSSGVKSGLSVTPTIAGSSETFIVTGPAGSGSKTGTSTFDVNPGAIASYVVSAGSPQTAGSPFTTTVTAKDANTNTVTTDSSTVVTMTGTGSVQFDSNGDSTFGDNTKTLSGGTFTISTKDNVAQSISITATSTGSKTGTSSSITVNAASANNLAFGVQPTSTNATKVIAPAVSVQIRDQFGNVTTNTSTVVLAIGTNPGGGTLSGTQTNAAVNGTATFNNLSIDTIGTGYTLVATSTGLPGTNSTAFNITLGAVTTFTVTGFPSPQTAGVAGSVTVTAFDAGGNLATNYTGTITFTSTDTQATLPASYTFVVGDAGAHTFTNGVTLKTAGTRTITATAGSVTGTQSGINVNFAVANKLTFTTQPANTVASATMANVVVQIQDAFGNFTTNTSSVTLAIGTNPGSGTLSGTLTVAASSGAATFSTLSIDRAGTGYTLAASAAGLTGTNSTTFTIAAQGTTARTWNGGTSTDWNKDSNWTPIGIPNAADALTITNGNTRYPIITTGSANGLSVAMGATGTGPAANITVSGGTLTIAGAITLSGSSSITNSGGTIVQTAGILTLNSGTTFIQTGGSNNITGASSSITGTLNISSGVFVSDVAMTINSGGVVTNSGGILWMAANTATAPSDSVVVNGTLGQSAGTNAILDLSGTGTMIMTGGLLKIYHNYNPATPANFTATDGTVEFAGSANNTAFNTAGTYQFFNVLIDSGVDPAFDNDINTIAVAGSWTNNGSPILTAAATTVLFNGTTAQNIAGSSTTVFANLTIANTTAPVTALTNFSIVTLRNCTINNGANLQIGTQVMSGAGTNIVASGATLGIGDPNGITTVGTGSGNIQTTGGRTYSTAANYIYNGTGAQATGTGLPAAVSSLSDNNTGGTLTMTRSAATTITNFALATGAKVSLAAGFTDPVGSFSVGGLGQVSGTWGSTSSLATHTNNTYFGLTTGILNVSTDTRSTPVVSTAPSATVITYGQTLASSILSGGAATNAAGATVSGSFAFTTPSIAPNAGTTNGSVTFTPSDTNSYNNATVTVTVTVNKQTPLVSAAPSATAITYGQTLAASSLSGGSLTNAAGATVTISSRVFVDPSIAPNAGTTNVSVTITPTDTANYNTATATVTVTVNKQTPLVAITPSTTAITYGQTLASSTLSGGSLTNAAGGTVTISTRAFVDPSIAPNAGTTNVSVTITPTDTANYNNATTTVTVTVNKATSTTVLISSLNPALPGSNVVLTATVSGVATPPGTVQFKTNGAALGSAVTLDGGGLAKITNSTLTHGNIAITAEYSGNVNFLTSTSSVTQTIDTPPVGGAHNIGAVVSTPVNLNATTLAGLDYDADNDTLSVASVNTGSPSHGTVSLAGTTITYTPFTSYVGTDSFTYTISDGFTGGTNTSTANVNVRLGKATSVLSPPTAGAGVVNLVGYGIPSHAYDVQRSPDMTTWTTISLGSNPSGIVAAANGIVLYTDTNPLSTAFYRLAVH